MKTIQAYKTKIELLIKVVDEIIYTVGCKIL